MSGNEEAGLTPTGGFATPWHRPGMGLAPRQRLFAQEYLIDLNAVQAAIRAGYSVKTAQGSAHRLLKNEGVKALIADAMKARETRTGFTAEWALRRLKREAEFDGEGASHSARVAALGLAMRHLGMLTEDAPHPDRAAVDLQQLSDDALDLLLTAVGPLLAPELRALGAPGAVPAPDPG